MGQLFRSEEMQLVQLFIQAEAAHDTLDELGRLGLIQFRDVSVLFSCLDLTEMKNTNAYSCL
jgi:vacuolar-type H+-ATPase subunit I/STV1